MEKHCILSLKQALAGECLLKAMKPTRVILPLLFGLGVLVSSKSQTIELLNHGYSIVCGEIKQ